MVFSQFSALNGNVGHKHQFQGQVTTRTDQFAEYIFSEYIPKAPAQAQIELDNENPKDVILSVNDPNEWFSDDDLIKQLTLQHIERETSSNGSEDSSEDVEEICDEKHDDSDVVSNDQIDDRSMNRGTIGVDDFEVLKVVGQGAFGKVFQVRMKGSSDIYAMKVINKDRIIKKCQVGYIISERDILKKVDHPFLVKLRYSFQTKYRLHLVLDFVNGGHLFFQLEHQGLFREDLARVYAAEIVSAVSHLHNHGIMHRDIKPENILLDADGHVVLTDFGLAAERERSNSICGTAEYMSPEIVQGKSHDKSTDWWSVGILLYEMLTGKPPYTSGNRCKIQEKIIKEKIKLPGFLTSEAHSLLKGLLQKEASKRLGNGPNGGEEIKRHKWFKSINWKKLEARDITPSFVPKVSGKQCVANFDDRWTNMSVIDSPPSSPKPNVNLFEGFTFIGSPI